MSKAVIQASVLQTNGALSVAAGAQIEIRTPSGVIATLYETYAGTGNPGNPFSADSKGFFRVYADPGRYDITVTTVAGVQQFKDVPVFATASALGTAATANLGHATGSAVPAGGATGPLTVGTNDATALTLKTNNQERLRITSTGNELIGTATDNGVDKLQVNGSLAVSDLTGAASSLYQSGTWACTLEPSSGFTPTSNVNNCRYVRIGNVVHLFGLARMTIPESLGTYVNNNTSFFLKVSGLPFPVNNSAFVGRAAVSLGDLSNIATVSGVLTGRAIEGTSEFRVWESPFNGGILRSPSLTASTIVSFVLQLTYHMN